MLENRCETNCGVYRRCISGELAELAINKFENEIVRIDVADCSSDIKEVRTILNQQDLDDESDALKRIVEVAENGGCKGPSFFTKTCRNPYAKTIAANKGNF